MSFYMDSDRGAAPLSIAPNSILTLLLISTPYLALKAASRAVVIRPAAGERYTEKMGFGFQSIPAEISVYEGESQLEM